LPAAVVERDTFFEKRSVAASMKLLDDTHGRAAQVARDLQAGPPRAELGVLETGEPDSVGQPQLV